jgi:hypothetical protein
MFCEGEEFFFREPDLEFSVWRPVNATLDIQIAMN